MALAHDDSIAVAAADNTIRYNSKRRHWRRTKLGI